MCNNVSMNKTNANDILDKLEQKFPNAKCELNYTTPFELLVAVILSAQCTDKRVNQVTSELFKIYNTPKQFAMLSVEELSFYIYSCGFYKNKATNIIETSKILQEKYNGEVPRTMEELTSLKGVGRKTANVVMSEAFKIPAIAVDTHVLRVSNRLGFIKSDSPDKVELALQKQIDKSRWSRAHHLFIFLGRYCCKSQNPNCAECPVYEYCKYTNKKA